MNTSEQRSDSTPCPKCRTLQPDNCHSMYCPMRPSNELSKTESGWRIGGTNESDSVQSPGYSTAIFDENETFVARSFGYTYDEAIERAKVICGPSPQQQPDTTLDNPNLEQLIKAMFPAHNYGTSNKQKVANATSTAGQPDELSKAQARIRELEDWIISLRYDELIMVHRKGILEYANRLYNSRT